MSYTESVAFEQWRRAELNKVAMALGTVHTMKHDHHHHHPHHHHPHPHQPPGGDMLYHLHRLNFYIQNQLAQIIMGQYQHHAHHHHKGCCSPQYDPCNPCPPPSCDPCPPEPCEVKPCKPRKRKKKKKKARGIHLRAPKLCMTYDGCVACGVFILENRSGAEQIVAVKLKKFVSDNPSTPKVKATDVILKDKDGNKLDLKCVRVPACSEIELTLCVILDADFVSGASYEAKLCAKSDCQERCLAVCITVPEDCGCGRKKKPCDEEDDKEVLLIKVGEAVQATEASLAPSGES